MGQENQQRKEPPFRLENGKKIYRLTSIINCSPRKVAVDPKAESTQNNLATPPAEGQTESAATQETDPGQATENPEAFRLLTRLVSAVTVTCWSPWLCAVMVVDFSYNDAAAIKQIPGLINAAARTDRPIPLMWNHTDDIRAKAGKIVDSAWENSADIPPGVNGYMSINRKWDPRAILGLETGEINATSIGIDTDKVRSHPDLDFWTFMELQGQELDGEVVRWLPLRTTAVGHHALVTQGADPYSGPREEQSTQNAATAAPHTHSEGDRGMDEKLIGLVMTLCNALGIDVALAAGSAVPDTLEKRVTDTIAVLRNGSTQFNELASKLQSLGNSLLKDGETTLSAADVLNRLPERIEMARHGEAFLKNQQDLAVGWFDKAKGDPNNPQTLSDVDKRHRDRIASSTDLQFLSDEIATHYAAAKARFGPGKNMRSSVGDELGAGNVNMPDSAEVRRAQASAARWERGGK